MIKLKRSLTPIKLTPDFVKAKTEEYKRTGNSVWNIGWLKDSLLDLSHGKCAYCECDVKKESNYMEVEHFEDKHHNPDKVMQWDNLLPSCKHCNGHKSDHDVVKEPIVNPFTDNPKDYLYLQNYRYKSRNDKGSKTIEVLELNDGERKMVDTRFEIGNRLEDMIVDARDKYHTYKGCSTPISRNKLVSSVYKMLRMCQPECEYAALCATVLHSSDEYLELKSDLIADGLWNQELDEMDRASYDICLFK